MPGSPHLSKSRFLAGLQCHKYLWWLVHEPDAAELIPDAQQQLVLDQGSKVGEIARTYVPGGHLVSLPYYAVNERVQETRALLRKGQPILYEGSFLAGNVYVQTDILERGPDGLRLVEVKSSTSVKDEEHLPDVAIQMRTLRESRIKVSRAEVMHLNRECAFPELDNLFVREDVTEGAEALQPDLQGMIDAQMRVLGGSLPDVAVGAHCAKPRDCPFMERCWKGIPRHHVSTLYNVRRCGADLLAEGIETVGQIPTRIKLTRIQERQRRAVQSGRLIVEPGLGDALQQFKTPLAVLDFETVAPAIPVWEGCHPYDAVPVQFSCHRVDGAGGIAHYQWIADGPGDPRREMARRVIEACQGAKTVVSYNAGFELRCLKLMATAAPDLADGLADIAARMADPLPVIRDHVYHPDFCGSFSLKAVLPALVPDLSYADMEIADGTAASAVLHRLIFDRDSFAPEEGERQREALSRYCALDTLGVVKLLERMRELTCAI